jgi:hypothetical protein
MAEPRNRDPNAPQNPPNSIVNPEVRRTALRTYLLPIVALFVVIGLALLYWSIRPPITERAANQIERDPNVEGTAGERSRGDDTAGGHEPQPAPDSTREELERRMGRPITDLGGVLGGSALGDAGRRVELSGVIVERVESATSFWVRDEDVRVRVVAPAAAAETVSAGQRVQIIGVVERTGETPHIRASSVSAAK